MKIGRLVRALNDTADNKKTLISIYYRADESANIGKKAYYKDLFEPCQEQFIKHFSEDNKDKYDYINNIEIDTYNNAPMLAANEKLPVILISSGLGMGRDLYTFCSQALAYNDYIVVAVEHMLDSEFVAMPDGTFIKQDEEATGISRDEILENRKKEILLVLNELNYINTEDEILKDKLDLSKIGAIGHSLGGYSAFDCFINNDRIKAMVMFDGSLQYIDLEERNSSGEHMNKPILNLRKGMNNYKDRMKFFIESNENSLDGETFKKLMVGQHHTVLKQEKGQRQLEKYFGVNQFSIKINRTEHLTFSDFFIIKNEFDRNGMMPLIEAHKIINSVTLAFFDEMLCKKNNTYTNLIENRVYSDIEPLDL